MFLTNRDDHIITSSKKIYSTTINIKNFKNLILRFRIKNTLYQLRMYLYDQYTSDWLNRYSHNFLILTNPEREETSG